MDHRSFVAALSNRRAFVLYRVAPRADGKTDKLPTDPVTGENINAHDPTQWMFLDEALMWAAQWGQSAAQYYGIGLADLAGCGIFALDLDNARYDNGGWMPHVSAFLNRFPGAAHETSVSLRGKHIFIRYSGTLPPHRTRNRDYRMEGYSRDRFIGLTGTDAEGSFEIDHTGELIKFLAEFFPPSDAVEHGVEWTTAPVPQWRGPADDNELVRRALRSHTPNATFGRGAAFTDLWTANVDVLSRAFPPQSAHQSYDGSAADLALANHLAFWLGNDCERMLRVMQMSALKRDKWAREDYIRGTILRACASQTTFHTDNSAVLSAQEEIVDLAPPAPALVAETEPKPGLGPGDYVGAHAVVQVFTGFCYVENIHAVQLPNGRTATKERFDARFAGPDYATNLAGTKPTRSAWDAFVMSQVHSFPRVDAQYFQPGDPTGHIREREGRREINCYQPIEIRRVAGDATRFLQLIHTLLPNGNDALILLYYMSACARYLGKKFFWTAFLQGCKGNGKSTVAKILQYCISRRYTHWAKAKELAEKFNAVYVDKLLIIIDEMFSDDRREFEETLKIMVTSDQMEVRPMYGEKTMRDIVFNMLLISNHQNAIRIDVNERRYAPLFCAQQEKADLARDGLTSDYFIDFHAWLDADGCAIIYDYLMSLEIPDEYNPATRCIRAPRTTSTDLAATASLGSVEQELLSAIEQQHEGFRGGWVSSIAMDMLLARIGKDKSVPRNARKGLIQAMGYVPHPSLEEGLCPIPTPDGNMPRLYLRTGHPWAVSHLTPQQVLQGFLEAQRVR